MVSVPLGGTRAPSRSGAKAKAAARRHDKGVTARAWFAPPSRTAADAGGEDGKADPAGEALCENMRELTAQLRGVFHTLGSEEQMQMEKDSLNQQCHSVALCESMRELTAQLKVVFQNLSSEEQTEAEKAALNAQCHPLVASLAAYMHEEAARLTSDTSLIKPVAKAKASEAPGTTPTVSIGACAISGVSPSSSSPAQRPPEGGSCGPSVSRVRTRSRARPTAAKERDPQPQRKRAASGESGPERLKRLGLVGIPPRKAEANSGLQSGNRQRRSSCEASEIGSAKPAQNPSKRAASERSSSKKASQISADKKHEKALSKTESDRRLLTASTTEVTSAKSAENTPHGEVSGSARRKEASQDKQHRARAATLDRARRDPQPQRKRAASGESGPERLKRLGLVGIPPRKAEANSGLQSGNRQRRRSAEVSDKASEKLLEASSCQPSHSSSRRAPSQRTSKKALHASQNAREKRQVKANVEDSMPKTEREADVQQMLRWAAAEAARTRFVASLSDGEGPTSRRAPQQGRLANRLRAATLERARLAREAMQSMLDSSGELLSHRQEDDLAGLRSGAMSEFTDGWFGQEAFARGFLHTLSNEPEGEDNDEDEELDSQLSQDEDEEEEEEEDSPSRQDGSSYLTDADRQRIGEVLAERRWLRQEAPVPPRAVLAWSAPSASLDGRPRLEVPWSDVRPSTSASQPDRGRPPSRGGESWQPLGQTTPPAYEQVTPELFELWQTQEPSQPPVEELSDEHEDMQPDDGRPEAPSEAVDSPSQASQPEVSHSSSPRPPPAVPETGFVGHQIPDVIESHDLEFLPGSGSRTHSDSADHADDAEQLFVTSEPAMSPVEASDAPLGPAAEEPALDDASDEAVDEVVEHLEDDAVDTAVDTAVDNAVVDAADDAVHQDAASPLPSNSSHASSSDLCQVEEIEVVMGTEGFQADEWISTAVEVPAESTQERAEDDEVTGHEDETRTDAPAEGLPAGDMSAHEKVTDEVVSVIMDELINDTVQSSAVTEPALRHPTPIAPAFIDIFSEDSAPDGSSAESETVVQPSPRRPAAQKSSDAEPGRLQKKLPAAAPDGSSKGAMQNASPKDAGPPRPLTPPPDMRSTATEAGSFAGVQASQPQPRPKGKQETAELISQDLLDMLLGEALKEFDGTGGAGAERLGSPTEEMGISIGIEPGSVPASPLAGPRPIDTSEAVVGPFIDAAFQQLGVTDEAQPVSSSLPDVEEWLPAVLEVMRARHRAACGAEQDRSKSDSNSLQKDEDCGETTLEEIKDIESFTRLLADALVELANEEVKEQGPRIMGWQRPCFGEAPLSRFREKQEGTNPSQRQTWEKVRAKLTEAVRFGWRAEAGADEPPAGGRTFEPDSTGGAVTLSNIDEGIDALLEEEICSDEASWLDIKGDVQKVKNQVAGMIFMDLVDEMVTEIGAMWSA